MTNKEAIKHLRTYSTINGSGQTTQAEHDEAKQVAIKALEQQREGHWAYDSYYGGFYSCSVCGHDQGHKTRYCPMCGAVMTEATDDESRAI